MSAMFPILSEQAGLTLINNKLATLKPNDTLQIRVRASYSDGKSRDVTRWARFASTEDLVAGVDEHGQVKVGGHGEAAITVTFANLVALSRVTSPYPNAVDAKVFAASPRCNFIDELVLKKLQALRLPPAPPSEDHLSPVASWAALHRGGRAGPGGDPQAHA